MLAATIRFHVQNSTGVALAATDTISVTGKFTQITTATGVMAVNAQITPIPSTSGNSLASGGFYSGSAIDTTTTGTTLFLEGHFLGSASISTATPAGNINIFIQESPDGGTTWPANGVGTLVGVIAFSAVGTITAPVEC